MKCLVFGKTGQVGRCLATRLRSLDSAWFLDREQADLSRPESMHKAIEALQPDIVINAAAYTAVDQAESEPEITRIVNAEAPAVMARTCDELGAWLIHYSTDYVFDGSAARPYTEEDATGPANVYGETKLEGERAIRDACERHLIFRTSWVYSNFGRNFLNTMLRLAGERDELSIVSDQVGAPTFAGSIADATNRIVHALAEGRHDNGDAGVYHMTCAGQASWYELANRIFELTGRSGSIRVNPIPTSEFPTPAARPMHSVLANDKLARVFGVALEPWDDALRKCLSERDDRQE